MTLDTAQVPRWGSRRIAVLAVLVLMAALSAVAGGSRPAQANSTQLTEGELRWGIKASWQRFAGSGAPRDGASRSDAGFAFALESGSYDDVTRTTILQFRGTVHYREGCGRDGCALGLRVANPRIVVGTGEQTLYAEVTGRVPGGARQVDHEIVALATLDVTSGADVRAEGDTTTWTGIGAALTAAGAAILGYDAGTGLDPVEFSYRGPGGAPDLGEIWTAPGAPLLVETHRWTQGVGGPDPTAIFPDDVNGVVHLVTPAGQPTVRAFDAGTLTPIETASWNPDGTLGRAMAFDRGTGRVFGTVDDQVVVLDFDPIFRGYAASVIPVGFEVTHLTWDAMAGRLLGFTVRDDGVRQRPTVLAWSREGHGWTQQEYPLPGPPDGFAAADWYRPGEDGFVAAPDGSVLLARSVVRSATGDTVRRPALLRLGVSTDGVTAEEVAGTGSRDLGEVAPDTYRAVVTAPNGTIWLGTSGDPALVQEARAAETGIDLVGGPVTLPPGVSVRTAASIAHPASGTLWIRSRDSGSLVAVRDGRVIHDRTFAGLAGLAPATIGSDGTVYATFRDAAIDPPVPGIARFALGGLSPTVRIQPLPVTVTLVEGRGVAVFGAAAEGGPVPTVVWQRKGPGRSTFTTIDGVTSPTLELPVTVADQGAQIRAVFSNPAGSVATHPARVAVRATPEVLVAPVDVTAVVGDDATFTVRGKGNREPEVTWQRSDGGRWVDIGPGSEGFTVVGGFLTVEDVSEDGSGSRFRARLTDEQAFVHSGYATLTVVGDRAAASGQLVTVTVPEVGPGEFLWAIDGSDRVALLSPAQNRGDHWSAAGPLLPLVISDTRTGGPPWSISGQVGDFTDGVGGRYLGWTPQVITGGAGALAGSPVASGWYGGSGLTLNSTLARAGTGHAAGNATVGADLDLRIPIETRADTYVATLTITALS